jgi:restriction system protein
MQSALIVAALGIGWFVNWWVALAAYLIGSLLIYLENARRLHNQLETAITIVNEHAKELAIRRKQLTIQQSYGLIDVSKWDKEIEVFTSRVIEPVTGALRDPKNAQLVADAIDRATQNFASTTTMFHPGMDPMQYEGLVADSLRDLGWETRLTKGSGDQGIDVIADMRETKVVIQCKLYSNPVGNSAVQEAIAGMRFEDADYAAVVSNASFTSAARQLATTAGVFLLHHEQLEKLEEEIFGTCDWKLRSSTRAGETDAIVLPPPAPRIPRALREALIIIGVTVVVVIIVTNYTRSLSPPVPSSSDGPSPSSTLHAARASEPRSSVAPESRSQVQPTASTPSTEAFASPPVTEASVQAPDDLLAVRQSDSAAADHIAEYCKQVTGGGSDQRLSLSSARSQCVATFGPGQ